MTTVLSLVQQSCQELGQPYPSSLLSQTDPGVLQFIALTYATFRDLRQMRWWPQLKKRYSINLQNGRGAYDFPPDFYAALPKTQWDQGNKWEMLGPLTDREFDYRLYGYITTENRKAYRAFGPDMNPNSGQGQFIINPVPDTQVAGNVLTFEYITKTWIFPQNWIPSTSYVGALYVNCCGNIYQKATGTASSGTVPPNMAYGQGQDGGVFWTALTVNAWGASTAYAENSFVTNGGNLYQCTLPGVSASSGGPTGTDDDAITDGTVTWQYCALTTWTAQTQMAFGTFIKPATTYYQCTTPGVQGNNSQYTGNTAPTWTLTTVSDGTITWTWISAAYESILADTDISLFDDDIVIAGIKWRWLRAKRLDYQDIMTEYTQLVDTAMNRYQSGRKISLASNDPMLAGLHPNIPEGNFGGS